MIRGQKAAVTAVRRPDGGVAVDVQPLAAIYNGWMRHTPFLRGIIVLVEAMALGISSLIYSANVSLEEEEEQLGQKSVWAMVIFALLLGVGLFFLLPLFLTTLADSLISNSVVFHVVEGAIRLAIFVAYLWLISRLKDIRRVFSYHGAEHKTVNAYEAGEPLEVAAVRRYSTAHPRCGTSFIFIVLVIAIVVFAAMGQHGFWIMLVSRIVLIPVIAGVSYEVTFFGARHDHNRLVRAVLSPGLWLQSLTTREPDDDQMEIGIAALKKALEIDRQAAEAQALSS